MQARPHAGRGDPCQPQGPVGQLPQQPRVGEPPSRCAGGFMVLQCRGDGITECTGQRREYRLEDHRAHHPLSGSEARKFSDPSAILQTVGLLKPYTV